MDATFYMTNVTHTAFATALSAMIGLPHSDGQDAQARRACERLRGVCVEAERDQPTFTPAAKSSLAECPCAQDVAPDAVFSFKGGEVASQQSQELDRTAQQSGKNYWVVFQRLTRGAAAPLDRRQHTRML